MEKRRIKVVIEVNPIPNSSWKEPMSRWGSMIRHDILFWRERNHIPRLVVHNKDTSSYCLKYYGHGQHPEQSPAFIITQKYLYEEKG